MSDSAEKKNSDKEVIETAQKRFSIGLDADKENRAAALEDLRFRAGDQWPSDIRRQRELDSRPCLTINKVPQFVHQITNDQRQNRTSIKIKPFDNVADPKTAEIIQGLIRNIENNSNADTAYDTGFEAAVSGGRGYWRILTDYCDPTSFDQEVRIGMIKDPNSVVLDPTYREPDGSDANWGFIVDKMSKEDYKAQYPDSEINDSGFDWKDFEKSEWCEDGSIRVAEYFEKIFEKDTLYKLTDGSTLLKSEIKNLSDEERVNLALTDSEIENLPKRQVTTTKVMWYKFNGVEILEKTEWPGQWIPIVPVHGVELIIDGKRVFEGIIRHAKDPQKMYNYWATCETEAIALAPKAPWVGAEGQFEGHKEKWNSSHLKHYAYLEYKPTVLDNGQVAPPPQRTFGEPNVQAITQARMLASDDVKATTGIYDAAMGNRSAETSGIAINRRTQQSQTSNFHYSDNLRISIRHTGRIIVDIIPKIYDTERTERIIGEDDEQEIVFINQIFQDKDGKQKKYDLGLGKYDVICTQGPSYSSKRQEASESMMAMAQHNPLIGKYAPDLIVKNMDWPSSDEISERLKKTIPPEILGEAPQGMPPQAQAQIAQLQQMVDQLTAALNEAQDKVDNKLIEVESKERIEMAKLENNLHIKQVELQAKGANPEDLRLLANEILDLQERLNMIGYQEPINEEEIAQQLENNLGPDQFGGENNLTGERTPGNPAFAEENL